jgi:predicted GNAT superfamily acetyltransferase
VTRRSATRAGRHGHSASTKGAANEIIVRQCRGLDEFRACIEVERAVWGSADVDLVPMPLFVVAAETGGQVLGAFDGERMVGFTMAIVGLRDRKPMLHSHMTGVLEAYRDRSVGRRLKLFQREDALSRGIEHVEWTFDPLQVKNAYFNFGLGAIARRYLPNLYGVTTSPLHAGLPTDRLVAEWRLRSRRVRRLIAGRDDRGKPVPTARGKRLRIRIPTELGAFRNGRPDEAARLQSEIRQEFEHWFARGYAATGIALNGEAGAEYTLELWRK